MHVSDPVLNFPATHCVHNPPLDPVEPALQVQAAKDELPAGASEYVGQSEHVESAVAPTAAEYLPVLHAVHASDPAAAENLPGPQSLQASVPVPALTAPAQHNIIVMFWYVIDYS